MDDGIIRTRFVCPECGLIWYIDRSELFECFICGFELAPAKESP